MIYSGINNYCATADMQSQLTGEVNICADGVTTADIPQLVNLGNAKVTELTYNGKVTSLVVESNNHKFTLCGDGSFAMDDEECIVTPPIVPDEVNPTISQTPNISSNENGWYKEDIYITVNVVDNESGVAGYRRCISDTECTPDSTIYTNNNILVNIESASNYVCVIGVDNQGNESEKDCQIYKLDKTLPTINGVGDIIVNINETVDLSSGVTYSDILSQIDGTLSIIPSTVDTSVTGVKEVTYSIKDKAGNVKEVVRNIIVDADAPTIVFNLVDSSAINSNSWAKNDFYIRATITDNSGSGIQSGSSCTTNSSSECDPIVSFTGTTKDFLITTEGSNRACVEVTDNNNKTTKVCSDTYNLDKTAPTAGTANFIGTLGSNNWYTTNVTVNVVNGSDSLSGHLSTTSNISSIINDTNNQIITITTTDKAGNSATRNYTIKVDKTIPIISDVNTESTKDSINTTVSANDSNSGISQYCFKKSTDSTYICQSNNNYLFNNLPSSTQYTLNIYVVDNAGNQSSVFNKVVETLADDTGACITGETLILSGLNGQTTMAKDIEVGDEILTFNSLTGDFELEKVFFVNKTKVDNRVIKKLNFKDGSSLKIFEFHRFFNVEDNYYSTISTNRLDDFVGLNYYKVNYSEKYSFLPSELVSYDTEIYSGYVYDFITENNFNYFADGFISSTVAEFSEPFDFSQDNILVYDMNSYINDVEKYGLISYNQFIEEFGYIDKEIFDALKGERVKIGIGKGYISPDDMDDALNLFG